MIQGNQAAARFKPGGWGRPEVLENGGGKLFSHVLRYTELRQARETGLTRGSQGLGNPRRFRNCYLAEQWSRLESSGSHTCVV